MKKIGWTILLLMFVLPLCGQEEGRILEGKVSYVTSQSVYVRFESTGQLQPGDTLYTDQNGKRIPVLRIKNLSSISCVCEPLNDWQFKKEDVIYSGMLVPTLPAPIAEEVLDSSAVPPEEPLPDSVAVAGKEPVFKQDLRGRISVASYSNFSNTGAPEIQRMRYTFSFTGNHLGNSKLSLDSYISFAHSNTRWDEIQDNLFNGLKIFNLAARYDFNQTTRILVGRKINPVITNLGAADGLQFEKNLGSFLIGGLAGSRPDYEDYSFNFNLFQYGAYVGHTFEGAQGRMQNSLAFVTQYNTGKVDRRFLYFQQMNTLLKNLYFFGTAELDLYKNTEGTPETTVELTNLYLSLRYRIIRQLTTTVSYTARNNIIFYETYRDYLERLLDAEMLQGWRLRLNYRPIKYLSVGLSGGYRFRKPDPNPSKNLYGYVTYSRLPGIGAAITFSTTVLETAYLRGNIYSLGLSRDILPGKLNGGLNYRRVDYRYLNSETELPQNIVDANLFWRIYQKLSISLNYEGTFESPRTFNRIFVNLSQRF